MKIHPCLSMTLIVLILTTACSSADQKNVELTSIAIQALQSVTESQPTRPLVSTATITDQPPTRVSSTTTEQVTATVTPVTMEGETWKFVFTNQDKLWIKEKGADSQVLYEMSDIMNAVISPDGNQTIFTRKGSSGQAEGRIEILSINNDGSNFRRLTGEKPLEGNVWIDEWSFSPDGESIIFVYRPLGEKKAGELWSAATDGSGIERRVGIDGSEPVEFANITAELSEVNYSPNLARIAFSTNTEIGILDQNGSILTELSKDDDGFDMDQLFFKQWSPDARHFSYLAGSDGCACGYDIIGDVESSERLKLHSEKYMSGYVSGFITWLDSSTYLYYDYPVRGVWLPKLILTDLEGELEAWQGQENEYVVDWWIK